MCAIERHGKVCPNALVPVDGCPRRQVTLVDMGDPGSGGDDQIRTPKVTCPLTCFYLVAQLPLRVRQFCGTG